jgi:hypothetical protein
MIKQEGEWVWEVTEVVMRKALAYGLPYSGICTIKIVNREVFVTGLLTNGKIHKSDLTALTSIVKELGFDTFTYKNGSDLKQINED